MKTLAFHYRGKDYRVSLEKETLGHFMTYGEHKFPLPNPSWIMLGVSFHHWRSGGPNLRLEDLKDGKELKGGIVWDIDHGTVRRWGGLWNGKIPRILDAWIEDIDLKEGREK